MRICTHTGIQKVTRTHTAQRTILYLCKHSILVKEKRNYSSIFRNVHFSCNKNPNWTRAKSNQLKISCLSYPTVNSQSVGSAIQQSTHNLLAQRLDSSIQLTISWLKDSKATDNSRYMGSTTQQSTHDLLTQRPSNYSHLTISGLNDSTVTFNSRYLDSTTQHLQSTHDLWAQRLNSSIQRLSIYSQLTVSGLNDSTVTVNSRSLGSTTEKQQ